MSSFWSWFISIISVLSFLGCYWLIRWTSKPRKGEAAEGEATGHTWDDDLQEYNNPLPRWWLWMFYITIVFGLAYMAIYPGLGNFAGLTKWTQTGQYDAQMAAADATYGPIFAAFAMRAGQRLFLNYCAQCHGSTATGAVGFPNLTDKDWLYDGSAEAIKASILSGRQGTMPPLGAGLGDKGTEEVAHYVLSLSGNADSDAAKAEAGKALFGVCGGCHGMDGKGNTVLGAPNLTDDIWLHSNQGSLEAVIEAINKGRGGQMPAHKAFLGEDKVHLLAAYVYSLSSTP